MLRPAHVRFCLSRLCLLLWLMGGLTAPAAPALRLVGVAQRDVTPDYAVRLNGYGGRRTESEGIEQRLRAKAIAIGSDAESPAVLITVDNCGVPDWIRAELAKRLSAKRVSDERLAICSSHTHSAPMLNGVLPTLFGVPIPPEHQQNIDRYTKEFTDQLEQVALAALADRQPGQLAWTKGEVNFARNRRLRTPTSYANSPNPEGPVDHELPLLRVTSAEGKLRALLASYACHCTTTGLNKMHADWAGSAQLAIEKAFPGVIALTAIGCGADLNPFPRGSYELADRHGQELAEEVKRLLAEDKFAPLASPLACVTSRIELPFDTLPTRAEWEEQAKKSGPDALRAQFALAKLDRGETIATALPYLLQVWNFGSELAMVFLPGEVVVDYSLRLKREFDGARLWVNAYANDVPCYIPSRRVWEEGGYEAAGAMVYYNQPNRFDGSMETRILEAAHQLMPAAFRVAKPATAPAVGFDGAWFKHWRRHAPSERASVLGVFLQSPAGIELVFDALKQGTMTQWEIPATARTNLLRHANEAIRSRATELLKPAGHADRAKALEKYREVASLTGSAARGANVYGRGTCSSCHGRPGGGAAIGPDLINFRGRPVEDFVRAIVDPSAHVDTRFVYYLVDTKDFRAPAGIVVAEDSASLTLVAAGGARESVKLKDIDELRASAISLMPEGLENFMSAQDMADLIAFLK